MTPSHSRARSCKLREHVTTVGDNRLSALGLHLFLLTNISCIFGLFSFLPFVTAEIWEGDDHRYILFLESSESLNGRNLFSELPFL